jgi:hypothetical protein
VRNAMEVGVVEVGVELISSTYSQNRLTRQAVYVGDFSSIQKGIQDGFFYAFHEVNSQQTRTHSL